MEEKKIPVYIFTGFLGSGKTTMIREDLRITTFGLEPRTLLIVCEEGEVEYDEAEFAEEVFIETFDEPEELTAERMSEIASREIDRVMIEYNGMWNLESLLSCLPENWEIVQTTALFDTDTFLLFNRNIRQQCFNKMLHADIVVFNRCSRETDKMPLHKEIRIANSSSKIVYEYGPYDIEIDRIDDPLPFDKSQQEIEVEDSSFAVWFRDAMEHPSDYDGKTIRLKGYFSEVSDPDAAEPGSYAFGRLLMTCCAEDIQYAGLKTISGENQKITCGNWYKLSARAEKERREAVGRDMLVLRCETVEPCAPAEPEVALFS